MSPFEKKEVILEALKPLVDLPLWDAGRAGDLEWFHFGPPQTIMTFDKKAGTVGKYALHIQCAWRIFRSNRILVGSQDMFYPAGDSEHVPEDFEWDRPGANRCDEKISLLVSEWILSPAIVTEVNAGDCGSVSISLTGGYILEVFPHDSRGGEYWRLFQPAMEGMDFVVCEENCSDED